MNCIAMQYCIEYIINALLYSIVVFPEDGQNYDTTRSYYNDEEVN